MLAERFLVLADLVALREIRIEVVLASEDASFVDGAAERQRRRGRRIRRAPRLSTGSAPGEPEARPGTRACSGAAPNSVEHAQNSLLLVSSWAWTSSPITVSYLASASVRDCWPSCLTSAAQRDSVSADCHGSRTWPRPWGSRRRFSGAFRGRRRRGLPRPAPCADSRSPASRRGPEAHQQVLLEDELVARVVGRGVHPGVHPDRVARAGLDAEATEHAAQLVDHEACAG